MIAQLLVEEIERALKEKGIKKTEFYKKTGISSASFSQWRNGKNEPSNEALQRICAYLDLTFDFTEEGIVKKEKPAAQGDGMSNQDIRLVQWFRSLPPEKQQAILTAQDAPEGLV